MGRPDPRFLVVGILVKAQGIRGEVLVRSMTDHPGSTYVPGVVVFPGNGEADRPDPARAPLRIEEARPFRDGYLVRFAGVADRGGAEALRGTSLLRPVEELEPRGEGEVFHHELLDMEVVTVGGTRVGRVIGVYDSGAADLVEVDAGGRRLMIPLVGRIVVGVDPGAGRMTVDPPDGLLEL